MFEVFESYLEKAIPGISKDEVERIRLAATTRKLRKREILLHEGAVCRHKIFVLQGLLRSYSLGEDGREYVMRFAAEGNWTSELESLVNGTPSAYYIDAIETSQVLLWTREDFEKLQVTIPGIAALSQYLMTQTISMIQKRVLMNISSSPEERYLDFIASFPGIFQRIPLHIVASYLGVSRETLTRVRQSLVVSAKMLW